MKTLDHLVYMANQIAKNVAIQGQDKAAQATAEHILQFWDPRMKMKLSEYAKSGQGDLSEISWAAAQILMEKSDVG